MGFIVYIPWIERSFYIMIHNNTPGSCVNITSIFIKIILSTSRLAQFLSQHSSDQDFLFILYRTRNLKVVISKGNLRFERIIHGKKNYIFVSIWWNFISILSLWNHMTIIYSFINSDQNFIELYKNHFFFSGEKEGKKFTKAWKSLIP